MYIKLKFGYNGSRQNLLVKDALSSFFSTMNIHGIFLMRDENNPKSNRSDRAICGLDAVSRRSEDAMVDLTVGKPRKGHVFRTRVSPSRVYL